VGARRRRRRTKSGIDGGYRRLFFRGSDEGEAPSRNPGGKRRRARRWNLGSSSPPPYGTRRRFGGARHGASFSTGSVLLRSSTPAGAGSAGGMEPLSLSRPFVKFCYSAALTPSPPRKPAGRRVRTIFLIASASSGSPSAATGVTSSLSSPVAAPPRHEKSPNEIPDSSSSADDRTVCGRRGSSASSSSAFSAPQASSRVLRIPMHPPPPSTGSRGRSVPGAVEPERHRGQPPPREVGDDGEQSGWLLARLNPDEKGSRPNLLAAHPPSLCARVCRQGWPPSFFFSRAALCAEEKAWCARAVEWRVVAKDGARR
jgi:hypothetical protein